MEGTPVVIAAPMPAPRRPTSLAWAIPLIVVAVAVGAWWTSRQTFEAELAEHHIDPATVIILDDETRVAVRAVGPRKVQAYYFDHDLTRGWDAGVGSGIGLDLGDGTSVAMMGWGGEDTLGWSALLYGVGPPGTASVEVTAGGAAVGRISDPAAGTFFIASRRELTPDDIRYRLLDAEGNVLFEGHGLGPAEQEPAH